MFHKLSSLVLRFFIFKDSYRVGQVQWLEDTVPAEGSQEKEQVDGFLMNLRVASAWRLTVCNKLLDEVLLGEAASPPFSDFFVYLPCRCKRSQEQQLKLPALGFLEHRRWLGLVSLLASYYHAVCQIYQLLI